MPIFHYLNTENSNSLTQPLNVYISQYLRHVKDGKDIKHVGNGDKVKSHGVYVHSILY